MYSDVYWELGEPTNVGCVSHDLLLGIIGNDD